jgi:hypothetical protein
MAAIARHRPFGITILAILAGLAALVALWHTLQYLHILPFTLGSLQFYGFDPLGALLWAVLAAIWIWAAMRLWTVDPRGLMFAIVLSGLNLLLAVLSILGASTFEALLPAILINAIVLLYCLTPGVRRAFGAAPDEFVPAGPPVVPASSTPASAPPATPPASAPPASAPPAASSPPAAPPTSPPPAAPPTSAPPAASSPPAASPPPTSPPPTTPPASPPPVQQ